MEILPIKLIVCLPYAILASHSIVLIYALTIKEYNIYRKQLDLLRITHIKCMVVSDSLDSSHQPLEN